MVTPDYVIKMAAFVSLSINISNKFYKQSTGKNWVKDNVKL